MTKLTSFRPAIGLANPNLQTIVSSVGRKFFKPAWLADFERHSELRDIHVQGQHLTARYDRASEANAPLVMIIHGWLGSAESTYVVSAAHALHQAGFHVARLTLRDHGNTADLNQGLFHSAMTDGRGGSAIRHDDFNAARLACWDFPWGAILLCDSRPPPAAYLAICPAISPQHTVDQIGGSVIYERYFMGKWRTLWEQKQAAFPDQYDFSAMNGIRSIQTLTELFIADHTHFSDLSEYYAAYDLRGSRLSGVNATILAAADDPIIPPEHYSALPPSITVDLTERGGHTAYIKNWHLESWVDDYAQAFFSDLLNA